MKKLILSILCSAVFSVVVAQSYNTELNTLGQYVQRMYQNEPFQGARIISDIDKCYLICVVVEPLSNSDYNTQRKAEVKGISYANRYLNGERVSQNTIYYTKEDSRGYSFEEIEDYIESRSMGYVQQMQVLTIFEDMQGKKVFVFCKDLPVPQQSKKKNRGK